MRSLFFKIFFSFWLTIVLMGVPFYFVGLKHHQSVFERTFSGMRDFEMRAVARYGDEALAAYSHGGDEGLRAYLHAVESQSGISLYLFSGHHVVPAESQVPTKARDTAERVLAERMEPPPGMPSEERWLGLRLEDAIGQLAQPLILVVKMPAPPPPPRHGPRRRGPWDNILLYMVAGGVVCYLLSRSLTAPIRKLRAATNSLAGGDFSVRVGKDLERAGSEVADLGRDFDIMAERIDGLLLAQKQLLRDISHELRSPLARLNVALELARQRAGEEAAPPLARIEKEAGRLNELIGELLTLTRLESGAQELNREYFELNALVALIADDARYEAVSRNRTVRVIADTPVMIYAARELIRRALENVVRNAVYYTAENTEVEITLVCGEDKGGRVAVLTTTDHGPGVPEEALRHLFEPFYRVAEARDRQSGGTGIGLAIADRAVRLHGGTVSAVNGQSGGLVITIALPLAGEN